MAVPVIDHTHVAINGILVLIYITQYLIIVQKPRRGCLYFTICRFISSKFTNYTFPCVLMRLNGVEPEAECRRIGKNVY